MIRPEVWSTTPLVRYQGFLFERLEAFYCWVNKSSQNFSMMGHGKNPDAQRKSCDLAEEVRRSNDARAKMIGDEKYDMFIMNPLFGSGLHYTNKDKVSCRKSSKVSSWGIFRRRKSVRYGETVFPRLISPGWKGWLGHLGCFFFS